MPRPYIIRLKWKKTYMIMAEEHPPANYVTKVTFYAAFLTPDT